MKHSYICLRAYFLWSKDCQNYVKMDGFVDRGSFAAPMLGTDEWVSWHQRHLLRRSVERFLSHNYGSLHNVRFVRDTFKGRNYFFMSERTMKGWSTWISINVAS
jgi:hypothetical protein